MTALPADHPLGMASATLRRLGIRYDAHLTWPLRCWYEHPDRPDDAYRERVIRSLTNALERNGDAQVALIGRKTTISDPYQLTVEMAERLLSTAEAVETETTGSTA